MKFNDLAITPSALSSSNTVRLCISVNSFFDIPKFALQRDAVRHSKKLKNSLKKVHGDISKMNYAIIDTTLMVSAVKFDNDCMREFKDARPNEYFKKNDIFLIDGNSRKHLWQEGELSVPNMVDLTVHTVKSFKQAETIYYSYNNSACAELKHDRITGFLADSGITLSSKFLASGYNQLVDLFYDKNLSKSMAALKGGLVATDDLFYGMLKIGTPYNAPLKSAFVLLSILELKKHGRLSPRFIEMAELISVSNTGNAPINNAYRSPLAAIRDYSVKMFRVNDYTKQTGQMLFCLLKYLQFEDITFRAPKTEQGFRDIHTNVKNMVKDLYENDGTYSKLGINAAKNIKLIYFNG